MNKDNSPFNKVFLLTGARVFGIIFSIIIPMYLGRTLSVETYGTYKQIMLFFWFSQVALNLGLDDSAYYFLRWDPKNFPLYSLNALAFNLIATCLLWAGMTFFAGGISNVLNNPLLESYLPILGFLTVVTVSSMQIEGILIGMNRFNERLMIEIGMEFLKSIAIMGAFYFYNSIQAVLIILSFLMTIRLIVTIRIILSYKRKEGLSLCQSPRYFLAQLKFGLPLGISRILQNVLNMENFFISSFFSLSQFTYYTVGCFENPLVNAARTSSYEVTNIEMIDALKNNGPVAAVSVWRNLNRKLLMIIIPLVIFMIFFAKEIVVFIFSEKYLPSVPFFMVFNLYLIVGALNPEPLFRANSQTHLALRIKIIGLIIGLSLLVAGAYWGGPLWALIGKIVGVLIMNLIGLMKGAKLLKSSIKDLFSWKDLLGSAFISILLSAVLRFIFLETAWHPFWVLALSFSLFFVFNLLASAWTKLIKEEEVDLLKKTLLQILTFKRTSSL